MNLAKKISFIPRYRYQPETFQAYNQADINNGNINERSLQHVDKFIRDCKEAGVWNLINNCYVFAGSNLSTAIRDIKGGANPTAVNFVAGDYSESAGLTGNGSTKYLDLGVDSGIVLAATGHYAFYQRTDSVQTGNRSCMGVINSGATENFWLGSLDPSTSASGRWGKTALASGAGLMVKGFYVLQRNSATDLQIHRNGVSLNTSTTNTAPIPPNLNILAWAWSSNGAPLGYNSCTGSFVSIGNSPMTAQNLSDYYAIVQTLQTNLGRAI